MCHGLKVAKTSTCSQRVSCGIVDALLSGVRSTLSKLLRTESFKLRCGAHSPTSCRMTCSASLMICLKMQRQAAVVYMPKTPLLLEFVAMCAPLHRLVIISDTFVPICPRNSSAVSVPNIEICQKSTTGETLPSLSLRTTLQRQHLQNVRVRSRCGSGIAAHLL